MKIEEVIQRSQPPDKKYENMSVLQRARSDMLDAAHTTVTYRGENTEYTRGNSLVKTMHEYAEFYHLVKEIETLESLRGINMSESDVPNAINDMLKSDRAKLGKYHQYNNMKLV